MIFIIQQINNKNKEYTHLDMNISTSLFTGKYIYYEKEGHLFIQGTFKESLSLSQLWVGNCFVSSSSSTGYTSNNVSSSPAAINLSNSPNLPTPPLNSVGPSEEVTTSTETRITTTSSSPPSYFSSLLSYLFPSRFSSLSYRISLSKHLSSSSISLNKPKRAIEGVVSIDGIQNNPNINSDSLAINTSSSDDKKKPMNQSSSIIHFSVHNDSPVLLLPMITECQAFRVDAEYSSAPNVFSDDFLAENQDRWKQDGSYYEEDMSLIGTDFEGHKTDISFRKNFFSGRDVNLMESYILSKDYVYTFHFSRDFLEGLDSVVIDYGWFGFKSHYHGLFSSNSSKGTLNSQASISQLNDASTKLTRNFIGITSTSNVNEKLFLWSLDVYENENANSSENSGQAPITVSLQSP